MSKKKAINCVDRSKARLIKGKEPVNDYVNRPAEECVAMVWQLTEELWSISGQKNAQQRLQRNAAVLKKFKADRHQL